MKTAHAEVFRTGKPQSYEVEFPGADGIRNYEALVGPVMSEGQVVALTVSARDITDRKKSELARLRALKRLEVLRDIDAAILKAQSTKDIASAALLGLNDLVASDRSSVTLLDFDAQRWVLLAHRGVGDVPVQIGKGIPLDYIFGDINLMREGKVNVTQPLNRVSESPVEVSLARDGFKAYINVPLVARGEVIGTLNLGTKSENGFHDDDIDIAKDIADVIAIAIQQANLHEQVKAYAEELEARVKQRTAALEAANRELESFSYSVSHDLRAPLRSIDGFSQAVVEDFADQLDATGQDYLRRIRRASQRMGRLIDDLLALSRINRSDINRHRINVGDLAGEVINTLRHIDPHRDVSFTVKGTVTAYADAQLMRVVLENLLGNAWKFTANNPLASIEVGMQKDDDRNVIYVRDNGAGFDMQFANKLFGAFQRLHSAEEFDGTGIGLASVQRIIHRHGGEVWAEGEIGKGATFYFTLGDADRLENYSAAG
jgi:signal transduction histidine kinase